MQRLVVYDLDGTLIDTLEDLTTAVNAMLRDLRAPELSPEAVQAAVGRGMERLVASSLRTEDPAAVTRGVELFREFYGRHLSDKSRLYPGVVAVLDHLAGGATQVVLTNKPEPFASELLRRLGIAGRFARIVGGNSGYPKKPDPAALQALISDAGAEGRTTVFVGDSSVDIQTGRRAGARTAAVAHGFEAPETLAAAHPDVLVADFRELLAWFQAQGW